MMLVLMSSTDGQEQLTQTIRCLSRLTISQLQHFSSLYIIYLYGSDYMSMRVCLN